jgi:acetoin utilization deacetylase AcuC-like enzyme
MTTGIVYTPAYLTHEQYPSHPERKERLSYTLDQLDEEGIWDDPRIIRINPAPANEDDISAVHSKEYLTFLRTMSLTGGYIDFDTSIPPGLYDSARLAAGGAIAAADAVCSGSVENAFALVRPPGHHARTGMGAGFCYLNNMAITVRRIQNNGYKKVMILDWDAHHGDGTQDIFYSDSSVLFSSIHQSPFYPGSGYISETGCGEGEGYTVNMPVPAGTTDDSYRYLFEQVIEPLACEFCPDFITVSAGQDNHFTDPLTGLALTAGGYAEMMQRAVDLSKDLCGGRLVAVLEGGYSVEAGLPYTNLGVIAAMAGMDLAGIREPWTYDRLLSEAVDPSAHPHVIKMTRDLSDILGKYWKCFSI